MSLEMYIEFLKMFKKYCVYLIFKDKLSGIDHSTVSHENNKCYSGLNSVSQMNFSSH